MNTTKIIEMLFYVLPSLITGGVAYYFFSMFVKNEENRRYFLLKKENQKDALPLRLQAYERMTLFLERIEPAKLLTRISPSNSDKVEYANFIISQIDQEFEHNLTQQIYMSDKCWNIILTAKNATIQILRKTSIDTDVANADALRQIILTNLFEKASPSSAALAFLKNEVQDFL